MNKYQRTQVKAITGHDVAEILHEATILHCGWEMDNAGWIVRLSNGTVAAYTTNHGGVTEWTLAEMRGAIDWTTESLESIQKAAEVFKDHR